MSSPTARITKFASRRQANIPPHGRKALKRLVAAAVATVLPALGGCGADEERGRPIPRQQAAVLESRLTELQRRFEFGDGACADIQEDTRPAVQSALKQIPRTVDDEVRRALRESFDHLFDLARQQCDETKRARTEPTQTTPPTPPPIQTIPPRTQPTQTETEPKDREEEKKKGDKKGPNSGLPEEDGTRDGVPIDPD